MDAERPGWQGPGPRDPEGPPVLPTDLRQSVPEAAFAERLPEPEPERPRPAARRAIFFDVENTSRPEHIARVLEHLAIDWAGRRTELVAVGNWRVIGAETGRLLAQYGAHLVHSAPSTGVRDWSDLRIAVSAGVWLAAARPGDVIDIVSIDRAFDAVGDVAAALGIVYRRLSYGAVSGTPVDETPAAATAGGERGRRGRRGRRRGRGAAAPAREATTPHTAPHDEIVGLVRELATRMPDGAVPLHMPPSLFDDADARLRTLAEHGARERYGDPLPPAARERLDHELGIIAAKGFSAYILAVWDLARGRRTCGRGSATRTR